VTWPDPERRLGRGSGNSRNGSSRKRVHTDIGTVDLDVPRDRNSDFDPKIVPKHARRLEGFNERIIALYGRGMTVRDIQAHLTEMYDVEVSPELISKVTDAGLEDAREWQNRAPGTGLRRDLPRRDRVPRP
jgi:putative transposase